MVTVGGPDNSGTVEDWAHNMEGNLSERGTPMLQIRSMRPTDLPLLRAWMPYNAWETAPLEARRELTRQALQARSESMIQMLVQAPGSQHSVMAEWAGRPVGFALVAIGPDGSSGEVQAMIPELFVLPQARGRGVGTAVGRAAMTVLAGLGMRKVKSVVDARNQPALRLAAKLGLKPEGLVHVKEW